MVWCNQLDVYGFEFSGESLTAEALIADTLADRKTNAVCNRHDLRRIAGTATPDFRSRFFAPA